MWKDAAHHLGLLGGLEEGMASVDFGGELDVCAKDFFCTLRGEFLHEACVGLGEFEFVGVDKAGLDEGAGLAGAFA